MVNRVSAELFSMVNRVRANKCSMFSMVNRVRASKVSMAWLRLLTQPSSEPEQMKRPQGEKAHVQRWQRFRWLP